MAVKSISKNGTSKKMRRRRAATKSLADIEAGTEALRQQSLVAVQELFTLIRTISSISEEERRTLFNAASKAIGETITSIGFLALLHNTKIKHTTARNARKGNDGKVAIWQGEAERLAAALWDKRPDYQRNSSKTAEKIQADLEETSKRSGFTPPKPGTVAKFIAKQMEKSNRTG